MQTQTQEKGLWEQNTDIHNENYVGTFVHFVIKRLKKKKTCTKPVKQVKTQTFGIKH